MGKKNKKDITPIVQSYLCHSCGSCFSACGHDCISYKQSTAGFLFPQIDYDLCTNCGLCFDVCPGDHFNTRLVEQKLDDPFIGNIQKTLVGRATNEEIYLNSQSGGATTAILKYLLDENIVSAVVVSQMNDVSLKNEVKIITNSNDLLQSQKSKYVPTSIVSIVPEILKIEGRVAIVGLSCHMHGLENLTQIKKKLDQKIIKIGLICDRVMLYSSIDFFTKSVTKNTVQKFVFRDTSNTQYPGDISFFIDDKLTIVDKKNRKQMKDFFTPTRCMLCFDKMNVYSDIVLGDPHAIDGTNKQNGESLVIVRTDLGNEIIQDCLAKDYIQLRTIPEKDAIVGQGIEIKKKKFSSNILAWKELGYKIPDYPQEVMDSMVEVEEDEIQKSKKKLVHSMKLDSLESQDAVFAEAKKYLDNFQQKKTLLYKIKKFFKG